MRNPRKLIRVLACFLAVWVANLFIPLNLTPMFANRIQRITVASWILIAPVAIYIVVTKRRFRLPAFIAATVLSIMVWSPWNSAMTFLCFYAAAMVFDDELNEIKLIADRNRPSSALFSVLIGVAIGVPLAALNLLGSVDLSMLAFNNPLSSAVRALTPAISEEVVFRFFLYALCIYLIRGDLRNKKVRILCLVLLVVPHALLHLPDVFLANPIEAVVSLIVLSLLFGLPMAMLQLKRDLVAAISLHWFIDFVRFMLMSG